MDKTSFDELYKMYSLRTTEDYSKYTKEETKEIFKSYLLSAIARFQTCYEDKGREVNELLETISPALTLTEKDITVELMCLTFLEGEVSSITSLGAVLTTNDYKILSGSMSLSEKESMVSNKKAYVDKLMAEYGTRINLKEMNKKKNDRISQRGYY